MFRYFHIEDKNILKAIKDRYDGFTIIELMVTVAVIAILAAIAIPNFLGLQERAKRRAMREVASSAKPELHHWIEAAIQNKKGIVDVDGDGIVTPGEIHTNLINLPHSWIEAFAAKVGDTPLSPWGNKPLFTVNAIGTGQISLSQINNGRGIKIIALGLNGSTQYTDSVSVE